MMELVNIQPLLDWLMDNQHWVAFALFFVAFLESLAIVGVIIPGVVLLFGISAIAGGDVLDVIPALVSAFAGAVLGDCFSFFLGKTLKERVRTLWPFERNPEWIANAEDFIARHGGKSVVIGRFVGPVRPVVPLVAGMLNMSSMRFVAINLVSALAWAPLYVLPGYIAGVSLSRGKEFPETFTSLLILSGLIVGFVFLVTKLCHWQLNPQSSLYQSIDRTLQRSRHAQWFWQCLINQRREPSALPLPMLLLFGATTLCYVMLILWPDHLMSSLNTRTLAFYDSLYHPALSAFFAQVRHLFSTGSIYILISALCLWLAMRRHVVPLTLLVCASIVTELSVLFVAISASGPVELDSPAAVILRVVVIFSVLFGVIAREVANDQGWWVYGLTTLPILFVVNALLFFQATSITVALTSVSLGFAIASGLLVLYRRYANRPLLPDWWLLPVLAGGILLLMLR